MPMHKRRKDVGVQGACAAAQPLCLTSERGRAARQPLPAGPRATSPPRPTGRFAGATRAARGWQVPVLGALSGLA